MITGSPWKNSVNAATGGIGILINKTSFNYLVNLTLLSKRIMIVNCNVNPQISIIIYYSPTNVSDPMEIENFYYILNSSTKQIPKHNVLIISGDFNAHLGIQDGFIFSLHEVSNRNGIFLKYYILEKYLRCLNTYYQKRKGQLWTHKSPNGNKVHLDYIMINRKWKNSRKKLQSLWIV